MSIIHQIYRGVNAGNLSLAFDYREHLNSRILELLNIENLNEDEVEELKEAIIIGNATFENSDAFLTPIENGIWDMMVEKYRRYTPDDSYPVGFHSTEIVESPNELLKKRTETKRLFSRISDKDREKLDSMIFKEEIFDPNYYLGADAIVRRDIMDKGKVSKRLTNIAHSHPDLVGTFDKCKFVLNAQAEAAGVLDDPRTRVMERDFFQPLIQRGLIDMNRELTIIATIKYDGISVEADVGDYVISARTRGDAVEDKASDITPILGGYRFPKMNNPWLNENPIGMKFEAIINNFNLVKFNEERGKDYVNCRTAMTGIIGSSDGYKYRDLITLVPISTDMKDEDGKPLDRLVEIEFLNQFYTREELLRYTVLHGTYTNLLFQIKKFVEEAEFARQFIPFMYDGVVFEFYDQDLREILGRDNAMDRYKCAIKFNPMTKTTIFRGYYYTIGQDGTVTPMICYDPVEFFGTTHPNSSGHSYQRFKDLDLHVGDVIDVTYINDVITYVTKPDNEHNHLNANNPYTELDSFPTHCPVCGSEIQISESGKSAYCPNLNCPERSAQRMASTLAKLGIVNFGLETVKTIGYYHIDNYFENICAGWSGTDLDLFKKIGPNNSLDLAMQLEKLLSSEIYDYKLYGALGFNGIAEKTFKLLFQHVRSDDFMPKLAKGEITPEDFPKIKGIGESTIKTLIEEAPYFDGDILGFYVWFHKRPIVTYGMESTGKQIRFTGFRNRELEEQLNTMGHDCDGNAGVTTKTDILLVPHSGYTQGSKVAKAMKYGVLILPVQDFINNMDQYL